MVDYSEAVTLFEKRRDAWMAEDLDGYLALFHEDLVFQGPTGEPQHGRAVFADLVRRSLKAFVPDGFDYHEISVHGSKVLAEWTQAIRSRESGQRLIWRGMSVCDLRDGLIVWWREYYDPAQLRKPRQSGSR